MINQKRTVLLLHRKVLKSWHLTSFEKKSFFNFIGFRSYFCNFVGMLQLSPINPTIFDTECYLYIS